MAKLSADEQVALDQLLAKKDAPDDEPRRGSDVSVFVDLSDENAVKRALKLRVLEKGDLDEFDDPADGDDSDDGNGDSDDDDRGKRDKRKPAAAPRRRLTVADRMMGDRGDD